MKGGMAESQAKCTIWANVSKETFERFTQFAYTGDYSIPKMEKRNRLAMQKKIAWSDFSSDSHQKLKKGLAEAKKETIDEPELANEWDDNLTRSVEPEPAVLSFLTIKKDKKKKAKSTSLEPFSLFESSALPTNVDPEMETNLITKRDKYSERHSRVHSDDFQRLNFPLLAPRNNHIETCEPAEQFDPDQSYKEAFLSHASLYILGDLQLIDSLKALALFKLHKTLCVFQLDDENAEDIVALARFAYSEEGGGGGLNEGIGDLRSLVCQYMATNAVVLSFNEGFMDLLGDGGQLVKDFFKYEVQRIS